MAVESTNADIIRDYKNEAKSKSKIEVLLKVSNVDLNNLHQQSVNENSQSNPNEQVEVKKELERKNISAQNAETKKAVEVFGIPISQNLQMPECNKQYGIYDIHKKTVCFERIFGNEKLSTPVKNETVQITFPISDSPKIVKNGVLLGTIVDGKLEGVNFNTYGVKNAEQVLSKLKEKYGEPEEYLSYVEENRLGQKFNAFSALWRPDNLEVYMQSILGSLTSGLVSIDTPKAKAVKNENLKALKKDPRPL